MKIKKCFGAIFSILLLFIVGANSCFANEIEDSEKLYVEIKNFLKLIKMFYWKNLIMFAPDTCLKAITILY